MSERTGVTVRWAIPADARAIATVHVASWQEGYRGLIDPRTLVGLSVDRRETQWRAWLAKGGERQLTLVAEHLGEIGGFCTLAMPSRDAEERDGVAEIPALYVTPKLWRAGLGTALIGAAADTMRERGFGEAILWMLEGNRRAKGFYARHGWQRDGGRRSSRHYPDAEELVEVRFRRAI
jgi:GNAT superfamily N-acetyltransferase